MSNEPTDNPIVVLLSNLKFITLGVGALYIVLKQLRPDLPFTEEGLLAFITTLLALWGIHAEARFRALVRQLKANNQLHNTNLL